MFIKYPHIERLGKDEVEGLLVGECHVFPKIDGMNASIWLAEDGALQVGSRRIQLSPEEDKQGFYAWLKSAGTDSFIETLLSMHRNWTLYGEWLIPHSLKTYRKDAWRKFYVFDIYDRELECFVHYDDYALALDAASIDYIPLLEICTNPTEEHLVALLDRNTFLIDDGNGVGEGIVIKRYGFKNHYGRTTWAKVVRNEFKEQNAKVFGAPKTAMTGDLEIKLAETYATEGRIQKILDKMTEGDVPWTSRRIPELFNRAWHDLITDELWGILKKHKNPTLDFRRFYSACVQQIKAQKPELF